MLTVTDLHKSFQVGPATYEVLKGVSLTVEDGEFVAVMGPSGSGKTTLLNCISCYIPADSGSIRLGQRDLARLDGDALAEVRNRKLGFVFQDFLLLDGLTVRENILLPRIIAGETGGDMEAAADRLCGIFGIGHIKDKYPAEISGGEKLPSMKSLKEEKDRLTASKNAQYEAYQTARTEQRELQTVLTNVQQMLGIEPERTTVQERDKGIT